MSLSTLQAQLAALNDAKTAGMAGLSYASNRRHAEAIGRGAAFSVQHGHATSQRRVVSLLTDAKDAADIPLSVLQEHCQEALQEINNSEAATEELLPNVCGNQTFEPPQLHSVLRTISILMGDRQMQRPCLQILEYLLRRYELHRQHPEELLWVFVPHMDLPAFARVLTLVDLTSNQSYLWLRPYATSDSPNAPPLALLAQHVLINAAWLRRLLQLTKEAGSLLIECGQRMLSWSATLLLKGFVWLPKTDKVDAEAVVRTLLPTLLQALRATHPPEWINWGLVVSSAMAEVLELAPTTVELLTSIMLQHVDLDRMTAVLSILLPYRTNYDKIDDASTYIPLLSGKWLGCFLPDETYGVLRDFEGTAAVLGELHRDRRVVVAPLVAAIMARKDCAFMISILHESMLLSMWKDSQLDLAASLTAWIVVTVRQKEMEVDDARSLLLALRQIDTNASDRGVANIVQSSHLFDEDDFIRLLRGVVPLGIGSVAELNSDDDKRGYLLPPRVALEHVDPLVRLDAIKRLSKVIETDYDSDENSNSDGEPLVESVLRRWSCDDDVAVAVAATKSMRDANLVSKLELDEDSGPRVGDHALSGLYKWINVPETRSNSIAVASTIAERLGNIGGSEVEMRWQKLIETLAAGLKSDDKDFVKDCAEGILVAMNEPRLNRCSMTKLVSHARKSLFRNKRFLRRVLDNVSETGKVDPDTIGFHRDRCALLLLEDLYDEMKATGNELAAQDSMKLCLRLICHSWNVLASSDRFVRDCLELGAKTLSSGEVDITELILDLVSIPSKQAFIKYVQSSVLYLCSAVRDHQGEHVSSFTVILEVANRSTIPLIGIERLLGIATDLAISEQGNYPWLAVVPAFALLRHSDDRVRMMTTGLLKALGPLLADKQDWAPVADICNQIEKVEPSAILGGSFLHQFLATCSRYQNDSRLAECLLRLCVLSAASWGTDCEDVSVNTFSCGWLSIDKVSGGCNAASLVMDALELAGETAFPLSARWGFAGRKILEGMLNSPVPLAWSSLSTTVARMFKGVIITDPNIVISTGPGRARTYSLGRMDGISIVHPYPKDMIDFLATVLTCKTDNHRAVASLVVRDVLSTKSWGEGVFSTLKRPDKNRLAFAILSYIHDTSDELPDGFLISLPFNGADVCYLLREPLSNTSFSLLTDFTRANATSLISSLDLSEFTELLLRHLSSFGSDTKDVDIDVEYTVQSTLLALSAVWSLTASSEANVERNNKNICDWLDIIISLFGCNDVSRTSTKVVLKTQRSRSSALSLLIAFGASFPHQVMPALTAVLRLCIAGCASTASNTNEVRMVLAKIVPEFWKLPSSARWGLDDLLIDFVKSVKSLGREMRYRLVQDFALALLELNGELCPVESPIAGLIVAMLVVEAVPDTSCQDEESVGLRRVVEALPTSIHVRCLVFLLHHIKRFTSSLAYSQNDEEPERATLVPNSMALLRLLVSGSAELHGKNQKDVLRIQGHHREKLFGVIKSILQVLVDSLIVERVQRFVQNATRKDAEISLRLWQALVMTHARSQHAASYPLNDDLSHLLASVTSSLEEGKSILLGLLPAPIFLASVAAIIKGDEQDEIKANALRLTVDRIVNVEPQSAEAELFLELLPDTIRLIRAARVCHELQQSALLALEHIGRCLGKAAAREGTETSLQLNSAIDASAGLLQKYASIDFISLGKEGRSTVCSAALCCTTLIRVMANRCLLTLPIIMQATLSLLGSTNTLIASFPAGSDEAELGEIRVMQLSLLRILLSVVETIPQFLSPYLALLFSDNALLSTSIRAVTTELHGQLLSAINKIDATLSSRVPPRLLIPAAAKGVGATSTAVGINTLLCILTKSIEGASSVEASAQRNIILTALTQACDFPGHFSDKQSFVSGSERVLLSLVMKLSEHQLRHSFAVLRDWRGDITAENPDQHATRRFAFWTLSAALAKDLRTIFLPCLSTVVVDAVAELELAANKYCGKKSHMAGPKRRRLGSDEEMCSEESMRCLQPLLSCLELSLRSDARDGGNWIRLDNSRRYHAILEPLGKLLQCKLPTNFPVSDGIDAFQHLVHDDVSGNIVGTLTALASAAGDEQLWKPLNHAVLEACSNGKRSEVRKAGLLCLLSLMRSLGEEYMVLLPECLPVLSELLEDTVEENAALARDCVSLAEELIGESLEDSLR